MQLVSEGAQLSRSFPSAEDQAYYVSLYPELKPVLDNVRRDCINLTQSLLQVNAASNSTMPQLNYRDPEEILANYNDIVYSVDEKLEYLVRSAPSPTLIDAQPLGKDRRTSVLTYFLCTLRITTLMRFAKVDEIEWLPPSKCTRSPQATEPSKYRAPTISRDLSFTSNLLIIQKQYLFQKLHTSTMQRTP